MKLVLEGYRDEVYDVQDVVWIDVWNTVYDVVRIGVLNTIWNDVRDVVINFKEN